MADVTYQQLLDLAAGDVGEADSRSIEGRLNDDQRRTVALFRGCRTSVSNDDSVAPPAESMRRARAIFRRPSTPSAPAFLAELGATIARLIFDARLDVGLRSSSTTGPIQLSFVADGHQIDFSAEPGGDGDWSIIAQVDPPPPPGATVTFVPAGSAQPLAPTNLDAHGIGTQSVPAGRYDVVVRAGSVVTCLPDIALSESTE